MANTYCLDLEFPEVNFDNYWVKCDEVASKHHAHLFSKSNEIEIRIYYDFKTQFEKKFSTWASTIYSCLNELQSIDIQHINYLRNITICRIYTICRI